MVCTLLSFSSHIKYALESSCRTFKMCALMLKSVLYHSIFSLPSLWKGNFQISDSVAFDTFLSPPHMTIVLGQYWYGHFTLLVQLGLSWCYDSFAMERGNFFPFPLYLFPLIGSRSMFQLFSPSIFFLSLVYFSYQLLLHFSSLPI